MNRFRLCILIVPMLASIAAADTLEDVEKQLIEKFSKYDSMSAEMVMDMGTGEMKSEAKGTMEFLHHEGKEKSRSEMTMTRNMGQQKMETHVTSFYNGEDAFVVQEAMGQKMVMKVNPEQMSNRIGGKEMFENLHEDNELKLLDDAKVDERDTWVIEAKPKEPVPEGPAVMKLYFDKEHGYAVKVEGLDPDGKAMMTTAIKNVKVNPKLDPARFEYTPEPGVQVMDMTKR